MSSASASSTRRTAAASTAAFVASKGRRRKRPLSRPWGLPKRRKRRKKARRKPFFLLPSSLFLPKILPFFFRPSSLFLLVAAPVEVASASALFAQARAGGSGSGERRQTSLVAVSHFLPSAPFSFLQGGGGRGLAASALGLQRGVGVERPHHVLGLATGAGASAPLLVVVVLLLLVRASPSSSWSPGHRCCLGMQLGEGFAANVVAFKDAKCNLLLLLRRKNDVGGRDERKGPRKSLVAKSLFTVGVFFLLLLRA